MSRPARKELVAFERSQDWILFDRWESWDEEVGLGADHNLHGKADADMMWRRKVEGWVGKGTRGRGGDEWKWALRGHVEKLTVL